MAEDVAKRLAKKEEPPGVVVQAPFFRRLGRRVGVSTAPIAGPAKPAPRPLHVARMLALAHEIVRLIGDGTFADQADAARALGFTRARITQLVDLTLLAPEIQEEILFAEVRSGRDFVSERALRRIGSWPWGSQLARWKAARYPCGSSVSAPIECARSLSLPPQMQSLPMHGRPSASRGSDALDAGRGATSRDGAR
jgi:hypothetical protein